MCINKIKFSKHVLDLESNPEIAAEIEAQIREQLLPVRERSEDLVIPEPAQETL